MAEWFKWTAIVARPKHDKRLAGGMEGMQVEQYIMCIEQRAQRIGNVIFKIARLRGRAQIPIEIAITLALLQLVSQGVGDGHQSQGAASEMQLTTIQFANQTFKGTCSAHFIAMHGAENDQTRALAQAGKLMNAK